VKPAIQVKITDLPAIPRVAFALLQLLSDSNSDTCKLIAIVKQDPALVARILRAANSPALRSQLEITSVEHAANWLGRKKLNSLALTFALLTARTIPAEVQRHQRDCWLRTLVQASAMESFAERFHSVDPEQAKVAGLLLNVGQLALLTKFPKEYCALLDEAKKGDRSLQQLESLNLSTTHADVSAGLLKHWNLPKAICSAARWQNFTVDQLASVAKLDDNQIVYMACLSKNLVDFLLSPKSEEPFAELMVGARSLFRATVNDIEDLIAKVRQKSEDLVQLCGFNDFELPPTGELLGKAIESLSLASKLQSSNRPSDTKGNDNAEAQKERQVLSAQMVRSLSTHKWRCCSDPSSGMFSRAYVIGRIQQRILDHRMDQGLFAAVVQLQKLDNVKENLGQIGVDHAVALVAQKIKDALAVTDTTQESLVARWSDSSLAIFVDANSEMECQLIVDAVTCKFGRDLLSESALTPRIAFGGVFVTRLRVRHATIERIMARAETFAHYSDQNPFGAKLFEVIDQNQIQELAADVELTEPITNSNILSTEVPVVFTGLTSSTPPAASGR
jgi:HD-like signal output (HDOD) protein